MNGSDRIKSFPYAPLGNGPLGHNLYDELIFHEPFMDAPWRDTFSAVEVLNHLELGYAYDTDPSEEVFFLHPHPPHKRLAKPPKQLREVSKVSKELQHFPSLKNILHFRS